MGSTKETFDKFVIKSNLENYISSFIQNDDSFEIEDNCRAVVITMDFNTNDEESESGTFIRLNSWDEINEPPQHNWLKDDYLRLKTMIKLL